jgi:hypothetical protein
VVWRERTRDLSGIVILTSFGNNRAGLEACLSFSLYLIRLDYKTSSLLALAEYSLTYLCDRCVGSSREALGAISHGHLQTPTGSLCV